jgi:hypothetical protein
MTKLTLKQVTFSFDALAIAYNHLANNLNGFEARSLKTELNLVKNKHDDKIKTLNKQLELKEKFFNEAKNELDKLKQESRLNCEKLEKKIAELEEEHKLQVNLLKVEHDMMDKEFKKEKEIEIKRLSSVIESLKAENGKNLFELEKKQVIFSIFQADLCLRKARHKLKRFQLEF